MARRKDLSSFERASIIQFLLQGSKDGKPGRGKMSAAVQKWSSSRRTISRLWAAAKKQSESGEVISSLSKKMLRPRRKLVELDLHLIASLDLSKRSTIRRLACGIKCSKSTVGRWIKSGLIRAHSNAIKPDLTAPNKLLRLRFSLEALEYDRILRSLTFKSMHNTVHIDEKWFYITKTAQRFYLTPEEIEPHRTCKSKKFITKVMFMCAVCRPIFNSDGSCLFDGKIGIFPFTELVPAKRKSKNRAAGTMEWKPIQSITKQVVKDCLINQIVVLNVLLIYKLIQIANVVLNACECIANVVLNACIVPAIKAKWPANASKTIYIQQDNARPHIQDSDPDFRAVASADGFDIHLVHQPPNSPDTNINDLGWFRAIQSLQTESVCTSVGDLVNAVINSFHELSLNTLNKVFLSLQSCMIEILKVKGRNSYKIPHLGKDALIRQDMLPLNLQVSSELVRECISYLIDNGALSISDTLMQHLGVNAGCTNEVEMMVHQLQIQVPEVM
ncbi:uncharacterized protein LOC130990701 [Salvia miltiorrhiza]|uniref:uncharacterized protein LOC130990701 n=1 Tax=Salvia miltiorrhiza TaxID=226208 RepID=UPI0025AC0662|nr:uncharacterized protein LOC130990701 [Salvia miltiorrhiza]